jgi:hypothetical protein
MDDSYEVLARNLEVLIKAQDLRWEQETRENRYLLKMQMGLNICAMVSATKYHGIEFHWLYWRFDFNPVRIHTFHIFFAEICGVKPQERSRFGKGLRCNYLFIAIFQIEMRILLSISSARNIQWHVIGDQVIHVIFILPLYNFHNKEHTNCFKEGKFKWK